MKRLDLGVCTFRRPYLSETLRSLRRIQVPSDLSMKIVVIDNDDVPSAAELVREAVSGVGIECDYIHAPGRNISIARNALLERSDAEWVGFIDDDETVEPVWLAAHWARAQETGADGLFGPTQSVFPATAPQWIAELDLHSTVAQRTRGRVETGPSGNVLLRWRGTPWQDQRFDLARGRSGGEDTEFFFRLNRLGARFDLTDAAVAYEPVPPDRLTLRWLLRRRYRAGQSYAASAFGPADRTVLAAKALGKSFWSLAMVWPRILSPVKWRYWFLRSAFHAGVAAGCVGLRQAKHYG